MTYASGAIVYATDFNNLVGYDPTTTVNTLNAVWGTGSGKYGYGQTPIGTLSSGSTVSATDWNAMVNTITKCAVLQGTTIPAMYTPVSGSVVTFDPLVVANLQRLYSNVLNNASQGTSSSVTTTNATQWRNSILFTHTITFATGDATRYFFNMGGQFAITFSATTGPQSNIIFNQLATECGTIVIGAGTVETSTIAGTQYQGITKVGGNGPEAVNPLYTGQRYGVQTFNNLAPTIGYYGMTTSLQEVFKQSAGNVPSIVSRYQYYEGSYISVSVKTNGSQGVYGDNGNIITVYTLWDQVPTGLQVNAGTTTTVTTRPPFLPSGFTKAWGTDPIVNGTVSGS
jgi:hypothetical protein